MSWTREDVLTEIRAVIEEHAEEAADLDEKTDVVGDLGIDSLGVMEVVADIEDKLDVAVPDSELRDVTTLGDLVTVFSTKLQESGRLNE